MKTPGFAGGLLLIAFQTTGSDNDFATVSYMRAGSYTAHITARDSERTFNFSSQFYHPGSGGLMCNYHIE